jgi:hypothetical protein
VAQGRKGAAGTIGKGAAGTIGKGAAGTIGKGGIRPTRPRLTVGEASTCL